MEFPFSAKLPSNFGYGSVLEIEAKPEHSDAWLSVTLFDGNQVLKDKYDEPKKLGLFQLQIRYDEENIIMNSIGPGAHVDEKREPLRVEYKHDDLEIKIKVTRNKYKVFLNDHLVGRFAHREHPEKAKYVSVYGDFEVKKMKHKKKE